MKYPLYKKLIPDSLLLKHKFKKVFGYSLDLNNPQTFNEKLQWLKINDRQNHYSKMVDKYEVKNFIREVVGDEYVIPTLGVWNCFEEIIFDMLPKQFVMKCTHDSGGVIICKDKNNLELNKVKEIIEESMEENFYWFAREWPYKNVKPRIIAEELLYDKLNPEQPIDNWKFYCSKGNVFAFYCTTGGGHSPNLHMTYFDRQKNYLPIKNSLYPTDRIEDIVFPSRIDQMIDLAEQLSKDMKFIRVDMYCVNDRIYIGELTFSPGGGFERIEPFEYDTVFGRLIDISN